MSECSNDQRLRRVLRAAARAALFSPLALGWLWAVLALWHFGPWPVGVRIPLALLWAAWLPFALRRFSRRRAWAVTAAGSLAVAALWGTLIRPSNDRDWSPDQARLPRARVEGDSVLVENVRHAVYRTADDYDVRWETRGYDLRTLRRVDFVVEPFSATGALAHTFLTFGFADGGHLAVSVEIRKERDESFSPVAGLFRRYEIMYVAGDERDLIGLRANLRKNPVYVFPVRATPAQARALFESMLRRADALAAAPEFYNTLTNTCTTSIVGHLEELSGRDLPFDLRVLFPGYSDRLAHELGLLDLAGDFASSRERYRINGRSAFAGDGRAWSRRIRTP